MKDQDMYNWSPQMKTKIVKLKKPSETIIEENCFIKPPYNTVTCTEKYDQLNVLN